jgi:hypothetical protein
MEELRVWQQLTGMLSIRGLLFSRTISGRSQESAMVLGQLNTAQCTSEQEYSLQYSLQRSSFTTRKKYFLAPPIPRFTTNFKKSLFSCIQFTWAKVQCKVFFCKNHLLRNRKYFLAPPIPHFTTNNKKSLFGCIQFTWAIVQFRVFLQRSSFTQ